MKNYSEIERIFMSHSTGYVTEDVVPSEWETAEQLSRKLGIGLRNMQRKLRLLLGKGLLESKTFRIKTGLMIRPVPHYRPKPDRPGE